MEYGPAIHHPTASRREGAKILPPLSHAKSDYLKEAETSAFFYVGVSSSIAFTAVQSSLVYYTDLYGASIFIYVNLCLYGPALPIFIAESFIDRLTSGMYSSAIAYRVRIMIALTGMSLVLFCLPYVGTRLNLLVLSSIIGIFSGETYSLFYQIALRMGDRKSTVFFAMGYQGSAVVVLLVALLSGYVQHAWNPSKNQLASFYLSIAVICLIGIAAFWWIDYSSELFLDALEDAHALDNLVLRTDSDAHQTIAEVASNTSSPKMLGRKSQEEKRAEELDWSPDSGYQSREHLKLVWGDQSMPNESTPAAVYICAIALVLTLWGSITMLQFFPYAGINGDSMMLPLYLFYIRAFCDMVARLLTLWLDASYWRANRVLLWVGLQLLVIMPLYFFLLFAQDRPDNYDLILSFLVGVFSLSNGYFNTIEYQLINVHCQTLTQRVQAVYILNIAFQLGIVAGLATGLLVQDTVIPPMLLLGLTTAPKGV